MSRLARLQRAAAAAGLLAMGWAWAPPLRALVRLLLALAIEAGLLVAAVLLFLVAALVILSPVWLPALLITGYRHRRVWQDYLDERFGPEDDDR